MNTPVREGETIEGSRTMRNRPYPVLKCSSTKQLFETRTMREGSQVGNILRKRLERFRPCSPMEYTYLFPSSFLVLFLSLLRSVSFLQCSGIPSAVHCERFVSVT